MAEDCIFGNMLGSADADNSPMGFQSTTYERHTPAMHLAIPERCFEMQLVYADLPSVNGWRSSEQVEKLEISSRGICAAGR